MSVSYLAATHTPLCLSLSCAERREVVVQQETLVSAVEHVVNEFLVELRSQCTCGEALCLSTCEDGASVRHRQR